MIGIGTPMSNNRMERITKASTRTLAPAAIIIRR